MAEVAYPMEVILAGSKRRRDVTRHNGTVTYSHALVSSGLCRNSKWHGAPVTGRYSDILSPAMRRQGDKRWKVVF